MSNEKSEKSHHEFILNDIVKRKILDMYNISKSEDITDSTPKQDIPTSIPDLKD